MIDDRRGRRKFSWRTSVLAVQGTSEQKIKAAIAASRASGCTCRLVDVRLTTSTKYFESIWIDVKHRDECRIRKNDGEVIRWFTDLANRLGEVPRTAVSKLPRAGLDYPAAVTELRAAQQCLERMARHLGVRPWTASATKGESVIERDAKSGTSQSVEARRTR